MIAIAAVGVVVSLLGTVLAWHLVGQLHDTIDESLGVTNESLATIEDTVVLADEVIVDVAAGLATLDEALAALEQGFADAGPLIDDVGRLSGDVPEALAQLQQTLGNVGGAAGEIDAVLGQLSDLPFAPDFDPQTSLSAQINRLSADIDPIIATLESAAGDLEQLAASTEQLQADVAALASDVAAISENLEESSRLVTQYRSQAEEASTLASDTQAELASSVRNMRLLILAAGLVYAASQFIPLWVGAELLSGPAPEGSGGS